MKNNGGGHFRSFGPSLSTLGRVIYQPKLIDDNILTKFIVEKEYHVLPILSAISAARSPQIPLTAVKTLSPASTALKMAHSIAV